MQSSLLGRGSSTGDVSEDFTGLGSVGICLNVLISRAYLAGSCDQGDARRAVPQSNAAGCQAEFSKSLQISNALARSWVHALPVVVAFQRVRKGVTFLAADSLNARLSSVHASVSKRTRNRKDRSPSP